MGLSRDAWSPRGVGRAQALGHRHRRSQQGKAGWGLLLHEGSQPEVTGRPAAEPVLPDSGQEWSWCSPAVPGWRASYWQQLDLNCWKRWNSSNWKTKTELDKEADTALFAELHRNFIHKEFWKIVISTSCWALVKIHASSQTRFVATSCYLLSRYWEMSTYLSRWTTRIAAPCQRRALWPHGKQRFKPTVSPRPWEEKSVFHSSWGSCLAWTLTANQPSLQPASSKGVPSTVSHNVTRSRRHVEITEAALVRDILYSVFQGRDGKIVKMSNTENLQSGGKGNPKYILEGHNSQTGWVGIMTQ